MKQYVSVLMLVLVCSFVFAQKAKAPPATQATTQTLPEMKFHSGVIWGEASFVDIGEHHFVWGLRPSGASDCGELPASDATIAMGRASRGSGHDVHEEPPVLSLKRHRTDLCNWLSGRACDCGVWEVTVGRMRMALPQARRKLRLSVENSGGWKAP